MFYLGSGCYSKKLRIKNHQKDVIASLETHNIQAPEPTLPRNDKLLSGYLSVSIDRAQGFHKNCNVWVALETDFYNQFTTQARTRIGTVQ